MAAQCYFSDNNISDEDELQSDFELDFDYEQETDNNMFNNGNFYCIEDIEWLQQHSVLMIYVCLK